MKKLILVTLILNSLILNAQSTREIKKTLKEINTIEQIDALQKEHPNWDIALLVKNTKDSIVHPKLKSMAKGDIITLKESDEKYSYKLLEIEEELEFRVSHLYLDGTQLHKNEIDSLRTIILEKYHNGTSFSDLSMTYASYPVPKDGDLGWFKENIMVPQFEKSVKEHKKGDIYVLDIPENNWYYVVLKTHEDRINKQLKVIRIKCGS